MVHVVIFDLVQTDELVLCGKDLRKLRPIAWTLPEEVRVELTLDTPALVPTALSLE
jgi:hypothetical protein